MSFALFSVMCRSMDQVSNLFLLLSSILFFFISCQFFSSSSCVPVPGWIVIQVTSPRFWRMTVMSSHSRSELLEPEDGDWIHNVLFTKLFTENTNIHYWQIVLECLLKFQCIAISIISPKETDIQCNGTHEMTSVFKAQWSLILLQNVIIRGPASTVLVNDTNQCQWSRHSTLGY